MNIKLSKSQLNKLQSAIKNETAIVLRLSSNMIENSDDETNFPHKLFLTNRQVANLRKAFANHTSTDIKLSKTQLSKTIQSEGFLGKLLGPLIRTGLPLIKNVIKPLAKRSDVEIHKKILRSGHNTTLIISNDEMEDILIVKSLENSGIFLKGNSETIKNEAKEQNGGFLSMLLGTLDARLLRDMLLGKGFIRAGEGTATFGNRSKRPSF